MSDEADAPGTEDPEVDPRWRAVFGHDQPYDQQVDGIETTVDTARDGGYVVLEGACGTGKTMLALTAGIDLVRDPETAFERVVVLTSVKQQLRQFEEDLRTVNANLPDDWRPVSGLTLVGKADVCPYARENRGGIDRENVYDRCETLRDRTRGLSGEGGPTTAATLADDARSQQVGLADSGRAAGGAGTGADGAAAADYLETAGEPAPYPPEMPEFDGDGTGSVEYCPFYAQFLDDLPDDGSPAEAVPFDVSEAGLLTAEDLVANSVEFGTCPHSMMGALLGEVEVVVGNYYHAFDPTTVASFTGALVDDSTFVVCDEAHMLEPRVRDLVSDGVADATLRDAESELTRVIQPLSSGERTVAGDDAVTPDLARGELADTDLTRSDLERVQAFVRDLREELDRRVTAHLDREHPAWRANLGELPDEELPLRDPETSGVDAVTEWAEDAGYGDAWGLAETVGAVVERVLNEAEDEQIDRATPAVGRVLAAWGRRDHERYFREIELERTWDDGQPADSWRRAYNARLSLHDCVPGEAIADTLGEFGGGVLMSATLQPFEAFEEVTGLAHLADAGRPVVERSYGLQFPADKRESFAVDAPKFTYENRGPPATAGGADDTGDVAGEENQVRRVYADALRDVATSPGNVLVGMPSYAEAEWAAAALRERVDKPVLLDESSDDATTEDLKDDFFAGDGKVLVTSLRGTLTEGVDYRGDRLSAAVVCGVPIVNTASPRTRAIRSAYDREFGDVAASEASGGRPGAPASGAGFRHALLVPAVRKARQAIGRVIRGPDERGVRVLVDARFARDDWDSVRDLMPPEEREEFQPVSPDMLSLGLDRFWDE